MYVYVSMFVCAGRDSASVRWWRSSGLHSDRIGSTTSSEEVSQNAIHHTGELKLHTYICSTYINTYIHNRYIHTVHLYAHIIHVLITNLVLPHCIVCLEMTILCRHHKYLSFVCIYVCMYVLHHTVLRCRSKRRMDSSDSQWLSNLLKPLTKFGPTQRGDIKYIHTYSTIDTVQ